MILALVFSPTFFETSSEEKKVGFYFEEWKFTLFSQVQHIVVFFRYLTHFEKIICVHIR